MEDSRDQETSFLDISIVTYDACAVKPFCSFHVLAKLNSYNSGSKLKEWQQVYYKRLWVDVTALYASKVNIWQECEQ